MGDYDISGLKYLCPVVTENKESGLSSCFIDLGPESVASANRVNQTASAGLTGPKKPFQACKGAIARETSQV